ncbi:alcohol dehydrogenase [Kitasatospora sp. MMS16-BH015]|uniref:quinone oxidoreductase family protein n=1 Tax=Kitasatospora sp. MMS16-BH015 TaxID=2018025 RepID=UPI000CA2DE65|nr:zinc-binding dehydrogenase [Kitasatospora sp. MMS16-BH015]AUG80584.1 alcohol dehydrogenase [Kitasatospora sp. MMS16-BH015]
MSTPSTPSAASTATMRAAVIERYGGPEEFALRELPEPVAGPGQCLIDVTYAGVNYADLHCRQGEYQELPLPAVLGADVVGRRRGDGARVAALLRTGGGYAEVACAEQAFTVELPASVSDEQGIALLEQGTTALGALDLLGRLRAGEVVAVTAAAGGVGHLAVQLARESGAGKVVGLASTAAKRGFVRSLGAQVTLDPADPELGARLAEQRIDLFVDSLGGPVLRAGFAALAPFGRLLSVGARSDGPEESFGVAELADNSAGVLAFWLHHVLADRARYTGLTDRLFRLAGEKRLVARIDRTVPLAEVGAAHRALAARETMGKVLVDVRA